MDALSLCEEQEDDLPKWLQEEPDEEERIFRFTLPASFPKSLLASSAASASNSSLLPTPPTPSASSSSVPAAPPDHLEFKVSAVGRHLQHVRGAIGTHVLHYLRCNCHCTVIPIAKARMMTFGAGRQVWPAAEVLVEYLYANHDLVIGKRILELGAGAGTLPTTN